jgi:gliding motility-associated-like protein
MKSKFLLIIACFLTTIMPGAFAQSYTYTLNGNPINTTGWTLTGTAFNNVTDIMLNNATTSQNGSIYYGTPQNLSSACDYFSVSFDFKFTVTPGVDPADGLAFWYIANPPSGTVLGAGLGMPANMNGFALIFDVYSNDNNVNPPNNPLITLRKFTNTGYTEGVYNGLIGSEVYNQSTLINGNWHTCTMIYQSGVMSVYLDGGATPIITGALALNNNVGYFGFSASTGALYETHAVKNVIISGGQQPDPVTVADLSYCVGATSAPLTVSNTLPNADIHWYTTSSGGTGSSTAPTPNTSVPGTTTWWVTQSAAGCAIESQRVPITVTVNPAPEMSISPAYAEICKGTPLLLTAVGAPNITWTPPDGLSATTGASVVANPVQSTTYRAIGTTPQGCKDTGIMTVKVLPSYNKTLNITINEGESYEFGDMQLMDPGTYKGSFLSSLGCDSTVTINLTVDYKDKKTMFPNAFTPNGDGRNDYFAPLSNYPNLITIEEFDIVNRWGQLVYSAYGSKAQSGWDGTFNGKVADAGVYYYYARMRTRDGVEEFKGEITLFR